jgi:hypothetical protein
MWNAERDNSRRATSMRPSENECQECRRHAVCAMWTLPGAKCLHAAAVEYTLCNPEDTANE